MTNQQTSSSILFNQERYSKPLGEINAQAFEKIVTKKGSPFSEKEVNQITAVANDVEKKHWEKPSDAEIFKLFELTSAVKINVLVANQVLQNSKDPVNNRHIDSYRHVTLVDPGKNWYQQAMIDVEQLNGLSKTEQAALIKQGAPVKNDYDLHFGFVLDIHDYLNYLSN